MRLSIHGPSFVAALAGEGLAGIASAAVGIRRRHSLAAEGGSRLADSRPGVGRSSAAGTAAAGCNTGSKPLWMKL